jgi:serine O-acetyltransferase
LAFVLQVLNKWMNQCVIGLHAQFGPGLVLAHPVGIIINSKVRGGSDIVIESAVVLGDAKGQSPLLGDDIYIGAGAKIIGGIFVGTGARIGANAVVVTDIPEGATAVGIPARVVRTRN